MVNICGMSEKEISFILASASQQRQILLAQAGYKFKVYPSSVDESLYLTDGIDSAEFTRVLALAKARDVSAKFPGEFVVGADTIVDFDGQIIGKPETAEHARQITELLFSARHKVITGVAIVKKSAGIELVDSDITDVFPKQLTKEQIDEHIAGGSWQGRAGAYGIAESGDEFVERIEGSFSNVCGMPMELFEKMFKEVTNG
jgi:septum formation protein